MKKIRLLSIILLVCLVFALMAPTAMALDEPAVTSNAIILADESSGRILYSKNADERVFPASLTKIMTVLLTVEAVSAGSVTLSDSVTASENCMQGMVDEGSTSNIVPGETMTLENLLYCVMLESANEGCNVVAEYIAGSIDAFVGMMNDKAEELGCTGTHFTNTHGLPDDNHYTTARDMYLITMEAVKYDLFTQLCSTVSYTVPATNVSDERVLSNSNGLINKDSKYYPGYYYEYATGVKTGHTSSAGYCLVSTAQKDGVSLLAVVMGGTATDNGNGTYTYSNFTDSTALYEWGFTNFSYQEILSSSELVTQLDVDMAAGGEKVTLRPKEVVTALLANDDDLTSFDRTITIYSEQSGETLEAPITAGAILGEITISRDGVTYGTTQLVASSSVDLSKIEYLKSQLGTAVNLVWVKVIFWVLIVALVGYLLLVIRYRSLHRKHQRDVHRARMEREQRMARNEETRVFTQRDVTASPAVKKAPEPVDEPSPDADGDGASDAADNDDSAAKRDYFEEFFRQNGGKK